MTDERIYEMVEKMSYNDLARELMFLESVFKIPDFPELALIDVINCLEIAVKDRISEIFLEMHNTSQT